MRTRLGLAAAFCILLTAGCSASGGTSEDADVTVSESEYRAAFETFAGCMAEAGYGLVVHDDSGIVIEYSIPGAVVGTPAESECYDPFQPIDAAWQIANEDSTDSALLVRECLQEHGIESDGTAAGDWALVVENELQDVCTGV